MLLVLSPRQLAKAPICMEPIRRAGQIKAVVLGDVRLWHEANLTRAFQSRLLCNNLDELAFLPSAGDRLDAETVSMFGTARRYKRFK